MHLPARAATLIAMSEHEIPVLMTPPRLTAETVPLFARVTVAYQERDLILDLSETEWITSAGLGHLVMLGRTLAEHGARLAFVGASRTVERLLDTIGLSRLMPHFTSVDEAATWMRSPERDEEA